MVGAPVFRYYPYVPGPYLPVGLRLLHISDDPAETGRAPVGDSLLGDAVLSLEGLKQIAWRLQTQSHNGARTRTAPNCTHEGMG